MRNELTEMLNKQTRMLLAEKLELERLLKDTYYKLFGFHIKEINSEVFMSMEDTKQCLVRIIKLDNTLRRTREAIYNLEEEFRKESIRRETIRISNEVDDV